MTSVHTCTSVCRCADDCLSARVFTHFDATESLLLFLECQLSKDEAEAAVQHAVASYKVAGAEALFEKIRLFIRVINKSILGAQQLSGQCSVREDFI